MKILIAIVTCHTRLDWSDAVRNTWVPLVKENVDVRFFCGRGAPRETLNDEVILDCDDSYQGLPNKVQEIIRWTLARDYDFVLKCDDDVVINPAGILASGFYKFDFTGHACAENNQVPWGFLYALSRKAMEIMVDQPLPQGNNDEAWVAHAMNRNGILLNHDERYCLHYGRNLGLEVPRRALRRPTETSIHPSKYFSWCMHNHSVSKEVLLAEFKRIFEREVKTQCHIQYVTPPVP
jgi:Galactosyltransferase